MNTTRAARRRSINRARAFTVTRSKLQGCDAFFVNASVGAGVDLCGRIATARQEFVPVSRIGTQITFRCGTHRFKADNPDLVETQTSVFGFARAEVA